MRNAEITTSLFNQPEWQNIQALIFDMDDTLYTSPELKGAYRQAACNLIAEVKGIDRLETEDLYHRTRSVIAARCGYTPSNKLILRELGIAWEIWQNQIIRTIDPGSFIRQDPELVTTLSILSSRYRLGLLTNNNRVHTDRILEILGVGPFFQAILTVSETGKTKPDRTLCSTMACLLDVLPEKCLVIGDEDGIDLIPARATGMKTYHVRHVSDVHRLRELFPAG
ncbi:MAG: HAD family hydrolase [Deltaproteobacteria bacterium]|nr:HAD family hydrolase [Deltaproteobacteria bacterium]